VTIFFGIWGLSVLVPKGELVTMSMPSSAVAAPAARLRSWDSIEWWVGNARAMAALLSSSFGFRVTAYAGPETGVVDRSSYLLEQGEVRLVVTAGLTPDSEIWNHVRLHGDGVHDLAFVVDDATATYTAAIARGARSVREPYELRDQHGVLRLAAISTYGETRHTFVDRSDYAGHYCPGYETTGLPPEPAGAPVGLTKIDHVVGNVEEGRLDEWVAFYCEVMGFGELAHFDETQIATEYSALRSTVVWNHGPIVMPLNEPAPGLKRSQIQEYLDSYRGPGVQHLAFRTDDVVNAIASLRSRGVRFLEANAEYYADVRSRLGHLDVPWDDVERLGILVDAEATGHLLQLFTEPLSDRPTVFFEIIQRAGARGFGEGNFKALFESIEREQARRGNL
jgi:4-hydroxyphenylpyruvate dioxygenase